MTRFRLMNETMQRISKLIILLCLFILCGCQEDSKKNNNTEFKNISLQDDVLQLDGNTVKLCTSIKSFLGDDWSVVYKEKDKVGYNSTACETVQNKYGDRMEVCGVNYEKQVQSFDNTTLYYVGINKKTWGGDLQLPNGITFGAKLKEVIKKYGNPVYFDHPYDSKYFVQFLSSEADMLALGFSKDGELDSVDIGDKNYQPASEYIDETSVCKTLNNIEYRKHQYVYKFPEKETELHKKVGNEKKIVFDGIEITDESLVKEVIDALNWEVEDVTVYDQVSIIELRKGYYTFRIDFVGTCDRVENLTDNNVVSEITIKYHPYDTVTQDNDYYPSVMLPGDVTADKAESVLKEYGLPNRYTVLQHSENEAQSEDELGTYGFLMYDINAFASYSMGFHKNGEIKNWSIVFSDYDIHKR